MKYKIYQITNEECDYKFEWWDWVKEKFDFKNDYSLVYEGEYTGDERSTNAILERLFEIFNIRHPKDFKGHSLSVSDVVELDGVKYYCDSRGWVKLD